MRCALRQDMRESFWRQPRARLTAAHEASALERIADLAQEQHFFRRRRGLGRLAHAVVGLEEQEDHERDDDEVDDRLEEHAVLDRDFGGDFPAGGIELRRRYDMFPVTDVHAATE